MPQHAQDPPQDELPQAEEATQYCSSCNQQRPIVSFALLANGGRRKTCVRHAKRAKATDKWGDVERYMKRHIQKDGNHLEMDVSIDYEEAPIHLDASSSNFEQVRTSAQLLARALWELSGFRFIYIKKHSGKEGFHFYFHCAQDQSEHRASESSGRRAPSDSVDLHDCTSRLILIFKPECRLVNIRLKHISHGPYCDRFIGPAVIEFIEARLDSTPLQIYQDLKADESMRKQAENVTQKQVWYWWKRRSASVWQRDSDPFVSLSTALGDSMLAGEVGQEQAATIMNEYCASRRSPSNTSLPGSASTPPMPTTDVRAKTIWKEGKPRAFAMYAIGIIASLGARTIEISLDATYGTNSSGHDLFAVLAELDGTGVPLLYLFMDTKDMLGDGRRIEILVEALRILKGMGLSPQFVGCDKDQAEINAIQTVWPNSKVQLCYWHVRRALRQRFSNSKATSTSTYHPFEAAATVSGLEPCWGVSSQRRHSDNPSICKCSCRSETSWDKPGRLEIPKDQNEMMINFVSRHFNLHPLFPNLAGTTLTSEQIRIQAATETYLFCRQRGWARLWAYLWTNWYNPDDWKLWARSSHPTIPVLKTTMICESHWRLIKHDYLHRFSRPRIDHVTHILRTRVLPQIVMRITSLLTGNLRMAMPSWRKEFVKLWRKSEGREVSPESLTRYRTSPDLWVCGCEAFLGSRFLICKHLISMVQPMSTSNLKRIQRHREPPLWTHPALIPTSAAVQAGNVQSVESLGVGDAEGRDEEDNADVRIEEAAEWAADDDEENELVPVSTQFDEAVELLTRLQNLVVREKPWLSRAFIEAFMRGNRQNIKLLEEDEQRLRRQTMPNTWTPGQHGATMYLRGAGSA